MFWHAIDMALRMTNYYQSNLVNTFYFELQVQHKGILLKQ